MHGVRVSNSCPEGNTNSTFWQEKGILPREDSGSKFQRLAKRTSEQSLASHSSISKPLTGASFLNHTEGTELQ